jgi:hypothetical protein
VVGLVWSNDPESYAGGSIATGRATMPGRSKGMIQTKRDTLVLQVGGWARGCRPLTVKKYVSRNLESSLERRGLIREAKARYRSVEPLKKMILLLLILVE